MNKRGQALIEFVLLLPIFMMIVFTLIDFSRVLYSKNHLEGLLNDTITMYQAKENKKTILQAINKNNDGLMLNYLIEDKYITIILSQSINLITPFAGAVLDNPLLIETQRTLLYEP